MRTKTIGIGIGAATLAFAAGCQHSRATAGVTAATVPRAEAEVAKTRAEPAQTTSTAPFATPPVLASTPDIATLAARVKPCVVNITTTHEMKRPQMEMPFPFGGHGQGEGPSARRATALGSGFVVDNGAHVVTNAHVVDGSTSVKVRFADDREVDATVKGKDTRMDLAVLEVKSQKDVPYCALGDSEKLRVGEYVVAVGNPFGLGHTVTMGIVSAKGRAIGAGPYDDFIQTDASINPGNSGGPLFNLTGQVVGINTAINPQGKGIGFAIPVDDLKSVLPQLIEKGHVERGRLGVVVQPVDETLAKAIGLDGTKGALVSEVEKGSPAESAGIKAGDVIIGVEGSDVAHSEELPRMVARHVPGEHLKVKLLREGRESTVDVALSAIPEKREPAQTRDDDGRGQDVAPSSGLGIRVADSPGEGVVVASVLPGSAAEGKLRSGDVIMEVAKHPVATSADVVKRVGEAPKDAPLLLKVRREGVKLFVAVSR